MFDIIRNDIPQGIHLDVLQGLKEFAGEHREALLNAGSWLGGSSGARCAHEALDSLTAPSVSRRRVLRYFGDLLALLMLEHVHETEREEAAIFAALDPGDPRVEDVCLLADGLASRLAACREAEASLSDNYTRRAAA